MFNSGIVLNHYFWSDIPANEQYVARKLNSFPEAGPVQLTQRVWRLLRSPYSFDVTQLTFTARDATESQRSHILVCVSVGTYCLCNFCHLTLHAPYCWSKDRKRFCRFFLFAKLKFVLENTHKKLHLYICNMQIKCYLIQYAQICILLHRVSLIQCIFFDFSFARVCLFM